MLEGFYVIVELFHNYFGTKPVVYRSRQKALFALVVFVFAGILCSSTAFAATCPGSPKFNESGWNDETEMWGWTNCEGKVTWQFRGPLEPGCVNYYEGGWEYENSKPGKWGRWHGEGITKQCVIKRDVAGKYDRIASGRFAYGKFVQGKLIEYENGRKRVCEGKFDGINHPRGKCVWTSLKSSNKKQTSPLYNKYQKKFNKLSKSEKNSLQYELSNLDLYTSNIDGVFGNGTFKALKFWKEKEAYYTHKLPNKLIKKFFEISDNSNANTKNNLSTPAKKASTECNTANLSNCDNKQASKKPIVTSTKKSSGSANSLGRQIQVELKRVGCYSGAADGKLGPKSRSALFSFTNKAEIEYDLSLFKNDNFLNLLRDYPAGTCKGTSKKASTTSTAKKSTSTQSSSSNTAEIQALRREREQLNQSLLAIQNSMAQQKRAANAAYNNCFSQCALNNKAGRGISNLFRGISACGNSCAPLKYGGAVKPPYWERRIQRMKTIDCTITQLSRNQATARCK